VLQHSAYDASGAFVFGQIVILSTVSSAAQNRVGIVELVVFVALAAVVLGLTRGRLSYKPAANLQLISIAR
jgi:hypothetical protein